ncbi:hypothetical protein [Hydrogenophaga sp.]|uniref:hypothetical protein n=1 Tax=Hydrogenophaga sp. TaxID=1904254 RepID=UPI00262D71E6|nr:hypothetical protein [Hydrogenophaga sp.]
MLNNPFVASAPCGPATAPTPLAAPRAAGAGLLAALAIGLAACGSVPAAPSVPEPAGPPTNIVTAQAADTAAPPLLVMPVQSTQAPSPMVLDAEAPAVPDLVTALLTYAERLRVLSPAELTAEIVLQGDPGNAPLRQMQLALALIHTHQAVDTAKALGLVQRVVNHTGPESVPFKPLARLLAARLLEQRRLEEVVDRQTQQLRDSQRRIDQLNDRLEAMRAIERSINSRPSAAPVPPASAPGAGRPAP